MEWNRVVGAGCLRAVFITSFPSWSVIFGGRLDRFERFQHAGHAVDLAEFGWCCKPGQYMKFVEWNRVLGAGQLGAVVLKPVLAVDWLDLPAASVRAFGELGGQFGYRRSQYTAWYMRSISCIDTCVRAGWQRRAVLLLNFGSWMNILAGSLNEWFRWIWAIDSTECASLSAICDWLHENVGTFSFNSVFVGEIVVIGYLRTCSSINSQHFT
jgi:hypothetical protein